VVTVRNLLNPLNFALQESNSLPLPKVEGDERAQARALATLYSHPVVSPNCNFLPLLLNAI
jgi:hypothetical protein